MCTALASGRGVTWLAKLASNAVLTSVLVVCLVRQLLSRRLRSSPLLVLPYSPKPQTAKCVPAVSKSTASRQVKAEPPSYSRPMTRQRLFELLRSIATSRRGPPFIQCAAPVYSGQRQRSRERLIR